MKSNKVFIIILNFIILTLAFIWLNSLQDNSISYSISNKVADKILRFFLPDSVVTRPDFYFLVRKAAHIAEFFVLGVLIALLKIYLENFHLSAVLFILLAAAVADEALQMFSDRNSNVMDIIIDFGGATAGLFFILGSRFIFLRIKNKLLCQANKKQNIIE